MKKFFLVFPIVLTLSACKVDMETTVNLDDVLATEHKLITSDIHFEVPTCSHRDDSRKESDSLLELKQKVPNIFLNAEYVECYRKRFDSFARFTIPVDVGTMDNNATLLPADVHIVSSTDAKAVVAIALDGGLIKRINDAQKNAMRKMDFNIMITVNRGDKPVIVTRKSLFGIDEKGNRTPIISDTVEWKDGKTATYQLSDVAKASLFKNTAYIVLGALTESEAAK